MINHAFTPDGTMAYVAGTSELNRTLVWVDRDGTETPVGLPDGRYESLKLSPDGQKIALSDLGGDRDVWIWDLSRRVLSRLTFDPALDRSPVWTADGARVAFQSTRDGATNVWTHAADGSGPDTQLTSGDTFKNPFSITPDGIVVVAEIRAKTGLDLVGAPIGALTKSERGQMLVGGPGDQGAGELSPDGHFLAYTSNETGRFEIYVRPYPNVQDGRWQVSTSGGLRPVWTREGRELVFQDTVGHIEVASVDASRAKGFRSSTPRRLAEQPYLMPAIYRSLDVTPDGSRVLAMKVAGAAAEVPQIIVVQNWFEELKRLLPAN
jgi:serine/threonine-protein kinase